MQCPECEYICFRRAKVCSGCGFNFKKAHTSAAALFRNDSFTIFARSIIPEKGQEPSTLTPPVDNEGIAVMEPPEDIQGNSELASGEFLLNLSDAEPEPSASSPESSNTEPDTMEFSSMEFGSDTDINLEEIEVEGLGLGLEPFDEDPSEHEILETEENTLEFNETFDILDLAPEPEENILEIIDEPKILDLSFEETEPLIEISLDDEPEIERVSPSKNEEAFVVEVDSMDEELELTPEPVLIEQEAVQAETEPPILDLGDDEIFLKIDEELELGSHDESPPAPVVIEELDFKLEIDDSDGPLITTYTETPKVEIEDLGLELEDSETPPTPDPEKP